MSEKADHSFRSPTALEVTRYGTGMLPGSFDVRTLADHSSMSSFYMSPCMDVDAIAVRVGERAVHLRTFLERSRACESLVLVSESLPTSVYLRVYALRLGRQ